MMKIIIIDDEEEIREIVSFTFEAEVDAEFVYAESGNQAITMISEDPDIDLIICDYNMPNGNGGNVYEHLLEKNIQTPYVLCSSSLKEEFEVFDLGTQFLGQITKPYVHEGVTDILKAYDGLAKKEDPAVVITPIKRNETKYSTIHLDLLSLFRQIPSDIFVKINEEKFVKVISKGDTISNDEINKYKEKKIRKLLIEKVNVHLYIDTLAKRIEEILESLDDDTNEEKVLTLHSVIMDTIRSLGLSNQIARATEKSVEFTLELFEKNNSFKDIADKIMNNNSSYLTKHSIALAYISAGIISKLPWDSPETRNKLVLASFLHDASIKNSDFDEALLFDSEDPNSILTFENHPKETVELLKTFKSLPPDVDTIILEHHEKPDGTGGPRQLTAAQIKPLSSIFIFAHDIVDIIFNLEKDGTKMSKTAILDGLNEENYSATNFRKSYEVLKKIKLFENE